MSTIYITQQGAVVSKVSERLKITLKKEILADIPLLKISHLALFGNITVTPQAVKTLLKKGIDICYLTQHGDYVGRIQPEISKNSPLRIAQYRAFFDAARRLEIARGFVSGKLANLRMTLRRKGGNKHKASLKKAIEGLKRAERKVKSAGSLNVLRGYEGKGTAAYFSVFDSLLKSDEFSFEKRVRRPPTDLVNALLSFGYTLLMNDLLTAVHIVGFDPYIGYLHAEKYGRPSLALDLMEEFRPLIVDAVVLICLNKRILSADSFQRTRTEANVWRLTDEGRRAFLGQYEARRKTEFTHPVLNQKMTYQQAFEEQTRLLAKTLSGECERYQPLLMK
ncbi:type I-D CRISPR-associated endonuclease Cas1 [candidate division KSB3 bacterium]|uniref:CRISPR-associated endonuclease Cas1 n=1 Tax=candidate division KSB3 bacterium TaxID=2044937 RepID=A0A2G6K8I5_9BACT|nr:MAG: type I-D CRISPR-associated endonuclease Cas1 [candidate division KSB3 bacterium]